jgi:hypothetical protein
MGIAGVIIAPGVADAVNNNPPGNPTSPSVSYEGDCTTSLQPGGVGPFTTSLDGNTSVDTAAPNGASFGFSGSASTTIDGTLVASLFTTLGGALGSTTLTVNWTETIGSTDGNAVGSYTYNSPTITEPDGGGKVTGVTWANDSTRLNGNFSAAAVGDAIMSESNGLPYGAIIKAIHGSTSATISAPTTASATSVAVGYGATTLFTDTSLNTGDVFTTNGTNGDSAGVGVTSIVDVDVDSVLQLDFGGAPGDGPSNCLETGYGGSGNPGPAQTCGAMPACATTPAFPAGTTTALPSVSPLEFPSAAYVNLDSLAITTTSLPGGSVYTSTNKVTYSSTLAADGGSPPYKWSLVSGSTLPSGLRLRTTGVISGKATTVGTYTFTVEVVDTKTVTEPHTQGSATATLSITIAPAT